MVIRTYVGACVLAVDNVLTPRKVLMIDMGDGTRTAPRYENEPGKDFMKAVAKSLGETTGVRREEKDLECPTQRNIGGPYVSLEGTEMQDCEYVFVIQVNDIEKAVREFRPTGNQEYRPCVEDLGAIAGKVDNETLALLREQGFI